MRFVLDASVAVRWFVDQPGHPEAAEWLQRFVTDPELFVAPDLIHFELAGALARLQPKRHKEWAFRCFEKYHRLGIRTLPTTLPLFRRAIQLSRQIPMGGYDAIYLAHAESLATPWLTADARVLRRLYQDPRVRGLAD